jgi:hypothetical protein
VAPFIVISFVDLKKHLKTQFLESVFDKLFEFNNLKEFFLGV